MADSFHLLGLEELLARLLEFELGFAAFGQIARDLGEADEASRHRP